LLRRLTDDGEVLLLHSYILAEAAALLQHRLGLEVALKFLRDSQHLHVHWVAETVHRQAAQLLEREGRRELSLVDCVSFTVMRQHGLSTAFAFDADFQQAGFQIYGN
jgi:predicted nucleic acid-binding protein